jgi:multimeric flavodoxin WrbA
MKVRKLRQYVPLTQEVAAHGVFIVCPVHWYQAPASLKLMMDRLVCADGGNPDPTTTQGKDPEMAKALELAGWPYPRHLAGRAFAVVAHGDSQDHEAVREALTEWLSGNGLIQAGSSAVIDTLIGYYEPYATSHEKLDASPEIFVKVENAAHSLLDLVCDLRSEAYRQPDAGLRDPRQK